MATASNRYPPRRGGPAAFRILAPVTALVLALTSGACERAAESPAGDGIRFTDVTLSAGIDFVHVSGRAGARAMPETIGGGVAWIDFDDDGTLDLYFVSGHSQPTSGAPGDAGNRLYRGRGDGRFEDVTEAAGVGDRGYGMGVAVGDYNGDGKDDIYVTNYGRNTLYRNEGGRFTDVTEVAGVGAPEWSTSAAFLDYDDDGWLDLYVCQYVDYDPNHHCTRDGHPAYCSPKEFDGVPDRLFRNRGDGTFEDVSELAGVAIAGRMDGKSLGVVVLDYDRDGDEDIYVACDQVRNLLFANRGDGRFDEVGLVANVAYSREGRSQAGMGVDAGDVDSDGDLDIVVTNFADEPNALYLADEAGFFTEASAALGLGGPSLVPLGFGVLFVDVDLDSDLDLYVANGHVQDDPGSVRPGRTFEQSDQILLNDGRGRLRDVSAEAGSPFARRYVSRGAAAGDYDGDGDLDIVVVHIDAPPALLRNDSARGAWIAFDLTARARSRNGYGARVTVHARRTRDGSPFVRVAECRAARSYAASSDPRVRFGLGAEPVTVERVEILWPSGAAHTLERPSLGEVHAVAEPPRPTPPR